MHISRSCSSLDRRRKAPAIFMSLALLLIVSAVCSLSFGAVNLPFSVFFGGAEPKLMNIFLLVRVPRAVAAALSGAALAVSGAILQSVLRNPLAAPSVIGVNSGAGCGAILAAAFLPGLSSASSIAAFCGAFGAVLLVYSLAKAAGGSKTAVILSGVALSTFFSAITDSVVTLFPDTAADRSAFMIGGFSAVSADNLAAAIWLVPAALVCACLLGRKMNILSLGDDAAASLGMRVSASRFIFLLLAALLASCAVSMAGLLGFVGLISPHMARIFVGDDNRKLLPACGLLGASLTMLCDLAARTLFAPFELPVGIVLSFLGAPFFMFLLIRKRGEHNE